MKALTAVLVLATWASLAFTASAEVPAPGRVAFFGLHFIDTSTEGAINGVRPDETARTLMSTALVADDITGRGFVLVPIDPVADKLAKVNNPARCNGCDVAMANELGADYALAGEVQKVSNLILNLNLVLRDASTGKMVRAGSVDIRGNTDESWQRGFRYLLKNMIFRDR
jgi:Protein of unknown function (DUF2380)